MFPTDRNKPISLVGQAGPLSEPAGSRAALMQYNAALAGLGDPTQNGPPGLTAGPTLNNLLQAFRRRWLLAVGLGVVGACLGVVGVLFLMPAKFTAQARLKVASRAPANVFIKNAEGEVDPAIWRANQIAIIKSPLVLSNALNNDGVKKLAISGESTEWLENALKIDYNLGPEILRISLSADNPTEVAALVNAVVDSYLRELDLQESNRRTSLMEHLARSKGVYEESLHSKRSQLRKLEQKYSLDPTDVVAMRLTGAIQASQIVNKEYRDILSDLAKKERELSNLQQREQNLDKEPVIEPLVQKMLKDSPFFTDLYKEYALAQKAIADTIRVAGEDHPSLPALRQNVELLQKNIDLLTQQARPGIEEQLRSFERLDIKRSIGLLQGNIELLQQQKLGASDAVSKMEEEVKRLDPKFQVRPLDVVKLGDEVTQAEEALKKVNGELANLKVEPNLASRIIRLQSADEPKERDFSKQGRFALVAALAMFLLTLGGVCYWECTARRVNDGDELVKGLGMSLVGTLPILPAQARRGSPEQPNGKEQYWQSLMTESVDSLRTMLLHGARQDQLQIVMVTSAVGGEGKTSLASQLATSLSRAWRKTLLIDGDLRNPAAHELFDLPMEPGLSEVLRGDVSVDDAVRATPLGRLWLLPAGHWDTHALQALAQDGVKALFAKLKEQYDFIIVDSCPILPVADSLLLGQHVDGVLLSVLRDVSRLPSVHAANQKLHALGIRTLGAVVIGGDQGAPAFTYGSN